MNAREFAHFIKGLGFRVFVAKSGQYGFITDAEGSRVLSYGFSDGGNLGGNYGPPSQASGTGWRMDESPWDLKTAEDVRKALYAPAPPWCRPASSGCPSCGRPHESARRDGWQHYTTLEQHLAMYQSSSQYQEI